MPKIVKTEYTSEEVKNNPNKVRLSKRVESSTNKIKIPKWFTELYGYDYYMDLYEGSIILTPNNTQNVKTEL